MSVTTSTSRTAGPVPGRSRTHYLYLAVIAAVVLGIVVGLVAPSFAVQLKPLGTAFVGLIKMMIQPVIFCTIVLGVGSVRSAARVGKVGGLALGYFLTMSTVALAIGLVVGNILHPGSGLRLTPEVASAGAAQAEGAHATTADFLLGIIPTSLVSALTSGEVLQTLLVALLIGFALQAMGRQGEPVLRGVGHLQRLVFRVLAMIMWAAPVGAFGAMAAVVGETGVDALKSLAVLMLGLLRHLLPVRLRRARALVLRVATGRQHLQPAEVPGPGVPAHPLDLLLRVRAAAADRQDGARGRRQADRGRRRPDRVLVQPGRHRDLPDDGLAVHRHRDGRPAEHR